MRPRSATRSRQAARRNGMRRVGRLVGARREAGWGRGSSGGWVGVGLPAVGWGRGSSGGWVGVGLPAVGSGRERRGREGERGAAVVEFVLVSVVAVVLALALAQLALFLWERNALMGSLSEGARVAATEGRTVADGRRVAIELLRRSAGGRVARAVSIQGGETGGLVVLRAEGTLPSFLPGMPGLPVRMAARMHEEEAL
jgi:hypothetical protein